MNINKFIFNVFLKQSYTFIAKSIFVENINKYNSKILGSDNYKILLAFRFFSPLTNTFPLRALSLFISSIKS